MKTNKFLALLTSASVLTLVGCGSSPSGSTGDAPTTNNGDTRTPTRGTTQNGNDQDTAHNTVQADKSFKGLRSFLSPEALATATATSLVKEGTFNLKGLPVKKELSEVDGAELRVGMEQAYYENDGKKFWSNSFDAALLKKEERDELARETSFDFSNHEAIATKAKDKLSKLLIMSEYNTDNFVFTTDEGKSATEELKLGNDRGFTYLGTVGGKETVTEGKFEIQAKDKKLDTVLLHMEDSKEGTQAVTIDSVRAANAFIGKDQKVETLTAVTPKEVAKTQGFENKVDAKRVAEAQSPESIKYSLTKVEEGGKLGQPILNKEYSGSWKGHGLYVIKGKLDNLVTRNNGFFNLNTDHKFESIKANGGTIAITADNPTTVKKVDLEDNTTLAFNVNKKIDSALLTIDELKATESKTFSTQLTGLDIVALHKQDVALVSVGKGAKEAAFEKATTLGNQLNKAGVLKDAPKLNLKKDGDKLTISFTPEFTEESLKKYIKAEEKGGKDLANASTTASEGEKAKAKKTGNNPASDKVSTATNAASTEISAASLANTMHSIDSNAAFNMSSFATNNATAHAGAARFNLGGVNMVAVANYANATGAAKADSYNATLLGTKAMNLGAAKLTGFAGASFGVNNMSHNDTITLSGQNFNNSVEVTDQRADLIAGAALRGANSFAGFAVAHKVAGSVSDKHHFGSKVHTNAGAWNLPKTSVSFTAGFNTNLGTVDLQAGTNGAQFSFGTSF